jgi:hypothetical protein
VAVVVTLYFLGLGSVFAPGPARIANDPLKLIVVCVSAKLWMHISGGVGTLGQSSESIDVEVALKKAEKRKKERGSIKH